MIKLFRNIRQNLLNEGKTAKYFKYAIGEIVLVVIGILIALQINTWNQNRINRNREKDILLGLKQEFISAKSELKADLAARNKVVLATEVLQKNHLYQESLNIPKDSLSIFFNRLITIRFYSVGHPILNDLAATGGLELIRSDNMRIGLDNYLQEKLRYMAVEETESFFVKTQFIPFISNYVDFSSINAETVLPVTIEQAIENISEKNKYGSLLFMRIKRTQISNDYGIRLMLSIDTLLSQLDNELTRIL